MYDLTVITCYVSIVSQRSDMNVVSSVCLKIGDCCSLRIVDRVLN